MLILFMWLLCVVIPIRFEGKFAVIAIGGNLRVSSFSQSCGVFHFQFCISCVELYYISVFV